MLLTRHNPVIGGFGDDVSFYTRFLYVLYSSVGAKIGAVSAEIERQIVATPAVTRSSVGTIYNPVVTPSFTQRAGHPLLDSDRVLLTRHADVYRILFLGRLVEQKGCEVLIDAIIRLREITSARFVVFIVGDGPLRGLLQDKSLSIPEVQFLGHRDNPLPILAQCDLLVLPSMWEGMPTVLVEALALKVEVLASDCFTGPRELLNDDEGSLFQVGDFEELTQKLKQRVHGSFEAKPRNIDSFIQKHWYSNVMKFLGLKE